MDPGQASAGNNSAELQIEGILEEWGAWGLVKEALMKNFNQGIMFFYLASQFVSVVTGAQEPGLLEPVLT